MPLFATMVSGLFNGLLAFFSSFLSYQLAIAAARRTMIVGLMVAFFAAVTTCVNLLLTAVSNFFSGGGGGGGGGSLLEWFVMAVGMFIPSNAGAVLSCLASVWVACVAYRLKMDGLRW